MDFPESGSASGPGVSQGWKNTQIESTDPMQFQTFSQCFEGNLFLRVSQRFALIGK